MIEKEIDIINISIEHMRGQFTITYTMDGQIYEQHGLGVHAGGKKYCYPANSDSDHFELFFECVKVPRNMPKKMKEVDDCK